MKKVLKSVLSLAMAFSVMQSTVSVYAEEMPEAEQETEITEEITETGEISEEEPEIPEEISEDEASPEEEPAIPEESAGGEQPETDPEVPAAEEEPAEEVQAAEVSQTQDTGETVPENEEEIYYEEAVVLGEGGLLSYDASIAALSDSQKALRNEIFRRMAQAAENFQTSVNIADLKVTTSEFGNLNIVAFYNKYPEYYYLQNGFSYSYSTYIISLTLRYDSAYPQSEVQTFRDRMNEILGMVDPGWNDEQKILFIHDYLVTHVEYDLTYSRYNAYDAIVTGSCVCQGYSEAFEALMHRLGIECDVISSNELNHAWNLVRLNGEYYYIDNTWDDYSNFYMGYCGHRNFLRNQAGIVGTDHSSTDWVNTDNELVYDNLQTSDTYDSYYWSDCSSYIPVISNKAYYVSDSKTDGVYVYDYATSSSRKLYSLTFRWNVYNNSSSWWGGNYASLEKYNDAVLCSTADSLYMIGTDGKGTKLYTLTSSEKADGYIYGIQVEGTRLRYDLYEKYDNSTFKGSHYYELPVPDVHVAGVSLSESELRLEVSEAWKLTAVVSPAGADNKNVTWSVSSGSAVTVDQSGNVTAVSEGTAVVTVTTEDGGFTADCSVTVYDPAADQEAADEVSTLIADLPDDITLDDKDAVEEARAAYEELTPEQKALVTNLEVLENAEAAIAKLEKDAAAAEAVYEMIDSLPSPVTLDDKAAVEAARAAYEALTDEQKELVTNLYILEYAEEIIAELEADIAAADAVTAMIAALPKKITLNDKEAVEAARTAYDNLTYDQQALVTNLEVLEAAEDVIAELEYDKEQADYVNELIADLPEVITLDDKDAVVEARAAYDSLTESQQAFVENLDVLEHAEAVIAKLEADKAAADAVIGMINALPETITLNNKAAVEAARAAYNALTDEQKALVTNLDVLENAEAAIAKLEADRAAADAVIGMISALPDTISLNDKAAVEAARAAYNALTDEQKALVTNLDVLENAEAVIVKLEKDKAAADAVIVKISELPDTITLNDKAAVEAARAAYDVLTEAQKALVTNYDVLENAEAVIAKLEADKAAADAVIGMINALPETITLNDKAAVEAARAAYDALTEEQKALVRNLDVLEKAEEAIEKLETDRAAADRVMDIINALPDPVDLEQRGAVEAARRAYDALTDEQKALVTNLDVLENAEAQLDALDQAAADEVIALIDLISDPVTVDDRDRIAEAREAYNKLTPDQKARVGNYEILEEAEDALEQLIKKTEVVWVKNLKGQLVQPYTGSAVKLQGYEVYFGKVLLKENTDYSVKYINNKDAGTAKMVITLKGGYAKYYEDKTEIEFTITPVNLEHGKDDRIRIDDITAVYTGKAQKANPAVYFNGKKLSQKGNYSVTYPEDMTEAGKYDVVIRGTGNFTGIRTIEYTIAEKSADVQLMSKTKVKIPDQVYDGESIEDKVKELLADGTIAVTDGKTVLEYDADYIVKGFENADRIGNAVIVLKGTEDPDRAKAYYGESRITFKIKGTPLQAKWVTLEYASAEFTGSALKPAVTVAGLTEDDYQVTYTNNVHAGTATVQITGKGAYSGTVKKTFKINKVNVNEAFDIDVAEEAEFVASGAKPIVVVKDSRTKVVLKEGVEYKLAYANNKAVTDENTKKMPVVKITGLGNYTGTVQEEFEIVPGDSTKLIISAPDIAYANKKGNYKTALKVLDAEGKTLNAKNDYDAVFECDGEILEAASTVDAGSEITVYVTGKGKYSGETIEGTYTVREQKADIRNISTAVVTVDPVRYTGEELKPDVFVKLKDGTLLTEGTDYVIESYANNINPSKAAVVIIRGTGDYSGTKIQKFTILKAAEDSWWSNVIKALGLS